MSTSGVPRGRTRAVVCRVFSRTVVWRGVSPAGVRRILTCAHCVAADGDPDEDDDAPPPKRLGRHK